MVVIGVRAVVDWWVDWWVVCVCMFVIPEVCHAVGIFKERGKDSEESAKAGTNTCSPTIE